MKPTIDDLIEILNNNGFICDVEVIWDNCYVNSDQLNVCWNDKKTSINVFYYDIDTTTQEYVFIGYINHLDVLMLGLSKLINVPDWALGENTDDN